MENNIVFQCRTQHCVCRDVKLMGFETEDT